MALPGGEFKLLVVWISVINHLNILSMPILSIQILDDNLWNNDGANKSVYNVYVKVGN